MERNRLMIGSGLLLLAPPLQESTGFLGVDWWIWILVGVILLLILLIIGFILQNEPGPPIPKRESKMYVTAASVAKKAPEPEPEPESEPEPELEPEPESEPEPEPEPTPEPDDLTRIEGVGPRVASLLNEAGITTFAGLADTTVERLNEVLESAELQFMEPSSWPEQASLAAKGDWKAFDKLTTELKGGRRES